jgi:hypothetical protein
MNGKRKQFGATSASGAELYAVNVALMDVK